GMSHRGSILCLSGSIEAWQPASVEEIDRACLEPVLAERDRIDLLLVGTGAEHRPLTGPVREALATHGIGVDVMTTGAAARTYNILLSEGRRVAAALIATDGQQGR
ncbi:MAG: Mth938-like domain-containing protein, partial [Hyphomicrobiaceae bacterium]